MVHPNLREHRCTVAAALRTGWGGQAVIVFPDHDTLVVLTGGDYVLQRQLTDYLVRGDRPNGMRNQPVRKLP